MLVVTMHEPIEVLTVVRVSSRRVVTTTVAGSTHLDLRLNGTRVRVRVCPVSVLVLVLNCVVPILIFNMSTASLFLSVKQGSESSKIIVD